MPRKSTFMDATVARELMSDCTVMRCADIYTVVSGRSKRNIGIALTVTLLKFLQEALREAKMA